MNKNRLFWIFFLAAGLFYRLWMASLAQNRLIWDSLAYSSIASRITTGIHQANCCNIGPGYPLFISLFYKLFDIDITWPVKVVQVILDTLNAVTVYLVSRRFFSQSAAKTGFILYITNPFTSSYTGIILTEVLTLTLILTILNLWTMKVFSRKPLLWILFGLTSGALVITKLAFYRFILFLAILTVLTVRINKRFLYILMFLAGFIITSFYAIFTNYRTFSSIKITAPYRVFSAPLYFAVDKGRSGELTGDPVQTTAEFEKYIKEYYQYYIYSPKSIFNLNKPYKAKLINKLRTRWRDYVAMFLRNNVWMWDKYHLFVYYDPFYPADLWFVRGLNISYILLFLAGIILFIRNTRKWYKSTLFMFTILLFSYVSVVFPLLNNETRLSIPFYPLIFLWGGEGISGIYNLISMKKSR